MERECRAGESGTHRHRALEVKLADMMPRSATVKSALILRRGVLLWSSAQHLAGAMAHVFNRSAASRSRSSVTDLITSLMDALNQLDHNVS
jgi:hypothetical protein